MQIEILKSKIAHATVTEAALHYEGSITVDDDLINAAGLIPNEKVDVLNLNNGSRIQTYIIRGRSGSGEICLNGPAARCGLVGDKIIILSYGVMTFEEAERFQPKIIYVDDDNKVKDQILR